MSDGLELTYDLRWFLLPELLFTPEIAGTRLDDARNALRPKLPCLIREIDRFDRVATRQAAKTVRDKMRKLGFFSRTLSRPPKEFLEREVAGSKSQLVGVPADAPKISIFAYTDPTPAGSKKRPTDQDCMTGTKNGSRLDCVLCASRFEAQKLAREGRGRALEIPATADIDSFWHRLDEATRGRQIARLFVFGHGFSDGVVMGRDQLRTGSPVPVTFQRCRFAKGAEIKFFGCSVAGKNPWSPESFMRELGTTLLCRGGSVTGFTTFVESECSREHGLRVRSDKADPVTISIAPCDVRKTLAEFLDVLDQFVAKGETAA